jgi:hypothetical protein
MPAPRDRYKSLYPYRIYDGLRRLFVGSFLEIGAGYPNKTQLSPEISGRIINLRPDAALLLNVVGKMQHLNDDLRTVFTEAFNELLWIEVMAVQEKWDEFVFYSDHSKRIRVADLVSGWQTAPQRKIDAQMNIEARRARTQSKLKAAVKWLKSTTLGQLTFWGSIASILGLALYILDATGIYKLPILR